MASHVDRTAVPDSSLRKAEMAKDFQQQQRHGMVEEEMDSGQMRLEAMGYKQVGRWAFPTGLSPDCHRIGEHTAREQSVGLSRKN